MLEFTKRTWRLIGHRSCFVFGRLSVQISAILTENFRAFPQFFLANVDIVLWRIDQLLGNYSVNIFPREPTRAKIGRLLIGNGLVNTPKTIRDNRKRCFLWGPPWGNITGSSMGTVSCQNLGEFSWRRRFHSSKLSRSGSSSYDDSRRRLRRNGKKGISMWKEEYMCDLKLQWDGYKSVARIWLVKTENPSACVTVNWKVYRRSASETVINPLPGYD
jgi:hypothetical protein